MERYLAIDWCKDCKHDYGHRGWDVGYCKKCLRSYKPNEMPIGYEQEKEEDK